MRVNCAALMISAALLLPGAATCAVPDYPLKPIRIVTGDARGAPDIAARLIGQELSKDLGQQVVIENKGGGSGAIAAQSVSRAPADGYSFLFYASALWLAPLMNGMQEDPLKDFSPVSLVASSPNVLAVHPSLPVRSVSDLIALAKAWPGALNYASGGVGSSPYLAGELFNAMAGVKIVRIGYKGGGPAMNDLIAGHVQMMFSSAGAAMEHVKSGRLRALAVTSAQPSQLAPGLPTVAASGLPGFVTVGLYPIFARKGTAAPIIDYMQQQIRQVLKRPEIKQKLLRAGVEPVGSSPDELGVLLEAEMTRWGGLFKKIGAQTER